MLNRDDIGKLLQERDTLIIDGALASELEVRGYDLNHPLWSAKILKEEPSSIRQVHLDYFLAGADIAITASYQAAPQGLIEHFGLDLADGKALISQSVDLAQSARDEAYRSGIKKSRPLLVAGSVGPYGAYLADGSEYRGDYIRTSQQFKDFHMPRIEALLEAGVDLLALETIPSINEIQALLELLQDCFPHAPFWLSCTIKSPNQISDGSSWKEVLDLLSKYSSNIVAIGINCIPISETTETLKQLHKLTELPLLCYPNSGESWNANTKTWEGEHLDGAHVHEMSKPHSVTDVQDWRLNGAKLIGGCCRTGPVFVSAVRDQLKLACEHSYSGNE